MFYKSSQKTLTNFNFLKEILLRFYNSKKNNNNNNKKKKQEILYKDTYQRMNSMD